MLVVDATTGFEPIVLALPILLIVFAVGRAVRHRTAMSAELKARTAELRELRDERVSLELADDRARLSRELDGLLQERLGQLTTAAESGQDLDAADAKALFVSIESDSRATLDGMRDIVGLLRGGDVASRPRPRWRISTRLLARHTSADSRLTVSGDPRSLPATVELSAYRIVEHLVTCSPTRRTPASRSACASTTTPSRSASTDPSTGPPTSRPPWPVPGNAPSSSAARWTCRVSRGHANAVAQLPVPG